MSMFSRISMLLMLLLGLAVVNSPILEDNVFISVLSVVHGIRLTDKRCDLKMHQELLNFQDIQEGIRIFNISGVFVSNPPECLHTKINVITQSGSETKPFLFYASQSLSELKELYWPEDGNNEIPPFHLTTIGELMDGVSYRKLTEKVYTTLTDKDAGDNKQATIYALDRGRAEIKCSFRRHFELESSLFQNDTWYRNFSQSFAPDDDCLDTEVEELTFRDGPLQVIYDSPQINSTWLKALQYVIKTGLVTVSASKKTIRWLIADDENYDFLNKITSKILHAKGDADFKDLELHAMNVEGEKHFSNYDCTFRKAVTYTVVKQDCTEMYNTTQWYIPDNPECLSIPINVITGPESETIQFIQNAKPNLTDLENFVGLNKSNLIIERTTIGAHIQTSNFAYLSKTFHRLVSRDEAEREGIISTSAEHQENDMRCAFTGSGWFWPVVTFSVLLALAAISGFWCYTKRCGKGSNDDFEQVENLNEAIPICPSHQLNNGR